MAEKPGTTKDKAAAESTKKTRTILTPAQRIAKMEADLAAEREKIQAKAKAKVAAAEQKVTDLTARRNKLNEQITAAQAEVDSLKEQAGITPEQPELPVDES